MGRLAKPQSGHRWPAEKRVDPFHHLQLVILQLQCRTAAYMQMKKPLPRQADRVTILGDLGADDPSPIGQQPCFCKAAAFRSRPEKSSQKIRHAAKVAAAPIIGPLFRCWLGWVWQTTAPSRMTSFS